MEEPLLKNDHNLSCDLFVNILNVEQKLSRSEILEAVKSIKNNKYTSSDLVSNKMSKSSMQVFLDPIYELFKTTYDRKYLGLCKISESLFNAYLYAL